MLGDSLIEIGICSELLESLSVINRGVTGDDSAGVLQRLSEVLERHPRVICLEIGIKDLQQKIPMDRVLDNVRVISMQRRGEQAQCWLARAKQIGFFDLNAS
jgi:lysophospholipase L1-like esterase